MNFCSFHFYYAPALTTKKILTTKKNIHVNYKKKSNALTTKICANYKKMSGALTTKKILNYKKCLTTKVNTNYKIFALIEI